MPLPTITAVHVDRPLTNQLIGFRNAAYIADDAAAVIPVDKRTNIIPKLKQSHFFRDDAKQRMAGTESMGGGWDLDNTTTYFCARYSYHHDIPDEIRDNTDQPYDQDREAAYLVGDKMQMARERDFAVNLFTTGVWGSDKVGGTDFNQWSNYLTSTPLEDIFTFKDSVESLIAVEPDTAIFGKQVLTGSGGLSNGNGLIWHPEILDTVKYTQKAIVTKDLLESLLSGFSVNGLRILIGRAIFTSTPEGVAEAAVTYSRIWGKHVLFYYNGRDSGDTDPGPQIWKQPAVKTYVWNRVANAIQYIKRMRIETKEVDRIEGNSYFQHRVLVKNAGIFLQNAVN